MFIYPIVKPQSKVFWWRLTPGERQSDIFVGSRPGVRHPHLVETRLDTSGFALKCRTDETGRTAYDPKLLLKIVCLNYAGGMVSSRKIEPAWGENVVFIAQPAASLRLPRPHLTHYLVTSCFLAIFRSSWVTDYLLIPWPRKPDLACPQ